MQPTLVVLESNSLLRETRVLALLLVGAMLGLGLPSQLRDMVGAVQDRGIWAVAVFAMVAALPGFAAWFWARAALGAAFEAPGRAKRGRNEPIDAAYRWLPRVYVILGTALAAIPLWRSESPGDCLPVWTLLACSSVLLLVTLRARIAGWLGIPVRTPHRAATHGALDAIGALFRAAPFGPACAWLLGVVLPLGFAMVAMAAPLWLGQWLPSASAGLAALAMMMGPLCILVFALDRIRVWEFRLPWVTFGLLALVILPSDWLLGSANSRQHAVAMQGPMLRDVHEGEHEDPRPDAREALAAWRTACAPGSQLPPVIIATAGGASRAALWTMTVLAELAHAEPDVFPRHIMAISAVSGGAVGAANAVAALSAAGGCGASDFGLHLAKMGRKALAVDPLAPMLLGLLTTDNIQRITAWPQQGLEVGFLPDRQVLLERSLAAGFDASLPTMWQAEAKGQHARPFLDLWRPGRNFVPYLLLNGTDVHTGRRVVVSSIRFAGRDNPPRFPGAYDALWIANAVPSLSGAVSNTNRFPIVSPAGLMKRADNPDNPLAMIDGGYFENFGARTAQDLIAASGVTAPIVIVISSDPEMAPLDVVRCGGARNTEKADVPPDPRAPVVQSLAPLLGLAATRGAHGEEALLDLMRTRCGDEDKGILPHFFHFRLVPGPGTAPGDKPRPAPLNWVLSEAVRKQIAEQARWDGENDREFQELRRTLAVLRAREAAGFLGQEAAP